MILEQLAAAGVQQAHKEDRIVFAAVMPWPGDYICAEGRYREGGGDAGPVERAGIFVGQSAVEQADRPLPKAQFRALFERAALQSISGIITGKEGGWRAGRRWQFAAIGTG